MAAPVQVPAIVTRLLQPQTSPRLAPRKAAAPALLRRQTPSATYRLQFGPGLDFAAARHLVPFLDRLGVSHVYASPIFQARSGSPHGYDVVDPLRLNPELGSAEEFEAFATELKRHGMGLILDIVPNHMAATAENPWWEDVLEEGPESGFARYFDIDWQATPPGCAGRLILPVLGAPCGSVLENGELRLALDERGFSIRYWEHRFPLGLRSYATVLSHRFSAWKCAVGSRAPAAVLLEELLATLERLPFIKSIRSSTLQKRAAKARLWRLYCTEQAIRAFIDANLRIFSGEPGDPASFELMDRLLSEQAYVLRYWRTGRDEVNYRRFFDVNELVAMRVEDEEVFGATHSLIFRLVREGKLQGLRIDHIDGLSDPAAYLQRLEECFAFERTAPKPYVVVEKILLGGEKLVKDWAARGTTGYDFLNVANAVLVDASNIASLDRIYSAFSGVRESFSELVLAQKKRVIRHLFRAELDRLALRLQALAACDRHAQEASADECAAAIEEATARLPVYRTYIRSYEVPDQDRKTLEAAAVSQPSALSGPAGRFLRRVLLLDFPEYFSTAERDAWLRFTMRWQQFTGPVMAKGMEDTACYIYNRLVSLNTVGGDVRPVTVDEFHRFNSARVKACPLSLNATSTHDSKRSEDVGARINVLSEIPDVWEAHLARWSGWNARHKRMVRGAPAPSANDEILLYQVLLGAWPLSDAEVPEFRERLRGFAIKAAREAKVHTDWLSPHSAYEEALSGFLDALLTPGEDNCFLPDFLRLQSKIAGFGAAGSLTKVLLKITCPGVPDIYQGTLLWDFSLVDPDNRRTVDFAKRAALFEELAAVQGWNRESLLKDLLANWQDGRIKLYTIATALEHRRKHLELYVSGDYVPLELSGIARSHAIAFARRSPAGCSVVIVPRILTSLCGGDDPFVDGISWAGSQVRLPAAGIWRNVFTGDVVVGDHFPLAQVLGRFPVTVLEALEME